MGQSTIFDTVFWGIMAFVSVGLLVMIVAGFFRKGE